MKECRIYILCGVLFLLSLLSGESLPLSLRLLGMALGGFTGVLIATARLE